MSKHTKCLPQHLRYRKHSRSISSYPTANKVLIHIRCLVIVVTDPAVSTTPVGDDTTLMSQIRKQAQRGCTGLEWGFRPGMSGSLGRISW